MSVKTVRRLAAELLNVGETHVKIIDAKRASEALTRDDVRALISEGAIAKEQKKGVGRAKARLKKKRLRFGRRRGPGSRKGKKFASFSRKDRWMRSTRALRRALRRYKNSLEPRDYRSVYKKIKGGFFKNKKQLVAFIEKISR